ncbi:hypothetical protein [Candidatus Vallotia lariciata]|uniref:hypothetical protein n=1 Tax=Candidatus Vallotia laricis TaxID=2018052 RepID=UPI001D00659F|nr:hypothetical protein [Candidatus Vallotia lariciata]
MNPIKMLFNEPTLALDLEMTNKIFDVIIALACKGMARMCVTHEIGFSRKMAHRVIFINREVIVKDNFKENFIEHLKSDHAKDFLDKILH